MDIITLEEYKDYEGIRNPAEDSKISILISSVSALIEAYLGLGPLSGGEHITEVINLDYDTDIVYLEKYPVASVLSVSETDRYTWDSTVHVPLSYGSDFVLDGRNGTLNRIVKPGGFANWPISPGIITVEYLTASKWGSEVLPADLKLAAIELVNYYRKDEFRQSKTIQGSSIVNTMAQGTDFPKHIQVILDRYKE